MTANDGTLTPTSVSFVIKRKSDGKFWNGTTNEWLAVSFENPATQTQGGTWQYGPGSNSRRLFVNTTVIVEAHAMNAGSPITSEVVPEIAVR